MAIIKHLTKKDYLTSTCKSKTFEDLGERLNELEQDLLVPLSVPLENEDGTFLVGTDKEGQSIDFEEGFAGLEIHGKSEQETIEAKNIVDLSEQPTSSSGIASSEYDSEKGFYTITSTTEETLCRVQIPLKKLKANTIYTISFYSTFSDKEIGKYSLVQVRNQATKVFGVVSTGTKEGRNFYSISFETDETANEVVYELWLYPKSNRIAGEVTFTYENIQIEEGLVATEFEAYSEYPSPSPDFPSEIKSVGEEVEVQIPVGKNLFNKDKELVWTNISNLTSYEGKFPELSVPQSRCRQKDLLIEASGNTTYTVTQPDKILAVHEFDATGTFIVETGWIETLTHTFTTHSDTKYFVLYMRQPDNATITDLTVFKNSYLGAVQIEKGSEATEYAPYRGGIEKRYKIGILSEGKNLFDGLIEQGTISGDNGKDQTATVEIRCASFIPVKPFVTYTLSRSLTGSYMKYRFYDENKNYLGMHQDITDNGRLEGATSRSHTFRIIDERVRYFRFADHTNLLDNKYQFEIGSKATDYEPYKSSKTTLLLKEPLRGLPNSVCDYIENGKVVRKVGKVVVDSAVSSNLTQYRIDDKRVSYRLQYILPKNGKSNAISDRFLRYNLATMNNDINLTGFDNYTDGGMTHNLLYFYFKLDTLGLTSTDGKDVTVPRGKEWFANNPTTVYYELAEPIEEEIHQSINPYVYENGHLTIDGGEVQPPTVHTVNTNTKGTVEANAKEIEMLKNNLDNLENFYDNYLLESDYAIVKTGLGIYFDHMMEG